MNHGFFDEKAVIALAFFVCIGLIIKFFGKTFINFLSFKQKEICDDINKNEDQFNNLENIISDLNNQKKVILERNNIIDQETEKEKNFIIETANKKAKELLESSISNQKSINTKITHETINSFGKIPFKVARDLIAEELAKDNEKIHESLIDRALDDLLNNEINEIINDSNEVIKENVKKKLNVLLIGSGGREYALAWKIKESKFLNRLFSINGSDGIAKFAERTEVEWKNFDSVLNLCIEEKIDLVIIGPEEPLVEGLADFLMQNNIKVFGPSMDGAQIEASKEFTKILCDKKNIPTAKYQSFKTIESLKEYLNKIENFPLVLKYNGLAAGKGVKVCKDLDESIEWSDHLYKNYKKNFNVIVEDCLEGREVSFFAITDGKIAKKFAFAQDYKRAFDNDEGENTGGMGAISGDFLIDKDLEEKIMRRIIDPTLEFINENKIVYRGIIFAGLMIDKNNDPYLIEFNARFGDPETEAMMMRLESDLLSLLFETASGDLSKTEVKISEKTSICIVLASKGYPDKYDKGIMISDSLPNDEIDCKIFHHGTEYTDGKYYANGGRVLSVNVSGYNIKDIRSKAYSILEKINWKDGFYRKDIGQKYES